MKKLLPFILFLGIGMIANQQIIAQCTPDSTLPDSVFISPASLPDGSIGAMYDEVISFRFPKDTAAEVIIGGSTQTISFDFCSFTIDSIGAIPPGLTLECDKPDCIYTLDHSPEVINRGCVTITGIPTDSVADDSLEIFVRFVGGEYDSATNVCTPDGGFLGAYLETQQPVIYKTRLRIGPSTVGIEDLAETLKLALFPNPTQGISSLSYELTEATDVAVNVIDLHGKTVRNVYEGRSLPGNNEHAIETKGLSAGIYLVQVRLDQGERTIAKKLIVQ